ncbi:hypothetical protein HPP92_015545 [Vanilla planifolia]|uniref:Uncharacterized protein n=1 Tax=Vanilla planifolia TaxID=51239 RepID=A0A835QSC9_VANPL|nr:hypothetical protein HPP92_015545 [Vanilla planifolia]
MCYGDEGCSSSRDPCRGQQRNADISLAVGTWRLHSRTHCMRPFGLYDAASSDVVRFCNLLAIFHHKSTLTLASSTILQEDGSVGGLEMMDSSGNFQAVDAVPGTFIVNLGDVAKKNDYIAYIMNREVVDNVLVGLMDE